MLSGIASGLEAAIVDEIWSWRALANAECVLDFE